MLNKQTKLRLAYVSLAANASTVPVKCLFSVAGIILNSKHHNMTLSKVNVIILQIQSVTT